MTQVVRLLLLSAIFLLAPLAGCGAGEIGEACETAGDEGDCVDGAVCTNESDLFICRKICDDDSACADVGGNCNGISGTNIKSCQP